MYAESKLWWQSKTLWFNGLTIIGLLLVLLIQQQAAGTLPFEIDPRWIVLAQALINFGLRLLTNQPVAGGKP